MVGRRGHADAAPRRRPDRLRVGRRRGHVPAPAARRPARTSACEEDEGVVLRPSWSIHTWFMRFPIDVVFVDADQVVIRIAATVKPFRMASCRGAREVVELRAGECERRGLRSAIGSPGRRGRRRRQSPGAPPELTARRAARPRTRRQPGRTLREAFALPARGTRHRGQLGQSRPTSSSTMPPRPTPTSSSSMPRTR